MFCSQCGAQLNEGAKFCGKCGTPVHASSAAAGGQKTAYANPAAPGRVYVNPAVVGSAAQQEEIERVPQSAGDSLSGWQSNNAQAAAQQGTAPNAAAQANVFWQVHELRENINLLAAQIEETKHSIRVCDVCTPISGLMLLSFWQLGSTGMDGAYAVTASVFILLLGASIPYGLSAIRSFGRNHGYVIVFHWVFLVFALMILCWICPFIAIPRALKMRRSVKEDEALLDQLQLRLASAVSA